jgi:phosphoribosyl 1,2-cyclic phosphodiesterase
MEIYCFASSSMANSYAVEIGNTKLLIETGLEYTTLRKKLIEINRMITDYNGCLVTHSHQDHFRSVKAISRYVPIYATKLTLDNEPGIIPGNKRVISEWEKVTIGDVDVYGFEINHDIEGGLGYIVKSRVSDEKLLFVTDTKSIKYDLSKVTFTEILVECNYLPELMDANDFKDKRTMNTHLSLTETISFLKTLNLTKCNGIYLIHLSDGNSDEVKMVAEVQKHTGIPTYVCGKYGGYK